MDKRERFITSVTCPECALNGFATWEEHESGNLETTIKRLSHGFRISPDSEIVCVNCGVKARITGIASGNEALRFLGKNLARAKAVQRGPK